MRCVRSSESKDRVDSRGNRRNEPAVPVHDWLIAYLNTWSGDVRPANTLVSCQTGLRLIDSDSRPEPDVVWLTRRSYRDQHPTAADAGLVIEVAASSIRSDVFDKAKLYASAGVVEHWVVDVADSCVHVFRQPEDGAYANRVVKIAGEVLNPLCPPQAALNLRDLFAT